MPRPDLSKLPVIMPLIAVENGAILASTADGLTFSFSVTRKYPNMTNGERLELTREQLAEVGSQIAKALEATKPE